MAGMTGIECAKKLKQLLPNLPIVMLSAYLDEEMLTHCLMAGACGCLFKPASAMEIVGAIKKAVAGSLAFCPQSEKTVLGYFARLGEKRDGWELTRRERDVLDGIRRQESDKEIAERLKIAPSTVHVHMASLFKKLKVHTRAEALMKILQ
jgi:DNA-binding NarL/FixJ family response regulator